MNGCVKEITLQFSSTIFAILTLSFELSFVPASLAMAQRAASEIFTLIENSSINDDWRWRCPFLLNSGQHPTFKPFSYFLG
jgi:hypothetical protein